MKTLHASPQQMGQGCGEEIVLNGKFNLDGKVFSQFLGIVVLEEIGHVC